MARGRTEAAVNERDGCVGKLEYPSHGAAEAVAKRMRPRSDAPVRPYHCKRHGWHVGSVVEATRQRETAVARAQGDCRHRWRGAQAEKKAQEVQE